MSFQAEHKQKFDDLKVALQANNRTQLKRDANGGNTVLFIYPPNEEDPYIKKAKALYPEAYFIDISQLFVSYIDTVGWDDFKEFYQAYETTPDQVFKNDDEHNLFTLIRTEIQTAAEKDRIPFVIRTGALHGTGIVNQHVMEDSVVLGLKQPVVFFYPGKIEKGELLFLNFKPASKYRCKIVQ